MELEPREAVIQDIFDRMNRDIDRSTAHLYFLALEQLVKELDPCARVALDYLTMKDTSPFGRVNAEFVGANLMEWASNIHHSTWGTNSLGAKLKARVVLMRIQGEEK